jgi:hypothetical protein
MMRASRKVWQAKQVLHSLVYAATLLVLMAVRVQAEPVLLGEIKGYLDFGINTIPYTNITAISIGLGYVDIDESVPLDPCVGCEIVIPIGQTSVTVIYDLNTSSSPQ